MLTSWSPTRSRRQPSQLNHHPSSSLCDEGIVEIDFLTGFVCYVILSIFLCCHTALTIIIEVKWKNNCDLPKKAISYLTIIG